MRRITAGPMLYLGLALLLLTVLCVGFALPSRFIESGVERFEGEERKMAELSYRMYGRNIGEVPGPGLFVTAYKVTRVEECPVTRAIEEDGRLNRRLNPLPEPPPPAPFDAPLSSAELQNYTIFGIPFGTSSIRCEGS